MDTSEQVAIETSSHTKRRRRTVEEKRRIVEETTYSEARKMKNVKKKSWYQYIFYGKRLGLVSRPAYT